MEPYFDNSLSPLTQVFLADYNGKLLHNMQPLYSSIHKHFGIQNIAPIQNKRLLQFSCEIPNRLKYDSDTNSGKILLARLLEKFNVKHLVSLKKQGFSVNTINMWKSYGKDIFLHYFDKSRLLEDKIINPDWIKQYASKNDLNVRYVNKLLGILALEIWYRIFITNEVSPDEKLDF